MHPDESAELLKKFYNIILENHDLTVRFKWKNENDFGKHSFSGPTAYADNDLAIWDNRSAFHTATFDYEGLGERYGNRAVGIGEEPYFDPSSTSRSVALGLGAQP